MFRWSADGDTPPSSADELAGFRLRGGVYQPIQPDGAGRLASRETGLFLARWSGSYRDVDAEWLRWVRPDGTLLATDAETAEQERLRAEQAERRITQLEAELQRVRETE